LLPVMVSIYQTSLYIMVTKLVDLQSTNLSTAGLNPIKLLS